MPINTQSTPPQQRFIVAEISKNWKAGEDIGFLLSQRFEAVINFNSDRGYKLIDWKMVSTMNVDISLNETIIAIFESITPFSLEEQAERTAFKAGREQYTKEYGKWVFPTFEDYKNK